MNRVVDFNSPEFLRWILRRIEWTRWPFDGLRAGPAPGPGSSRNRLAAALAVALFATSPGALAHPFGQSSVNRLIALQVGDDRSIRIAYVLDLGELPAYGEITVADRDGDGSLTPAETDAYLDQRLPRWMSTWHVRVDGRESPLRVVSRRLEAPPGENGMSTLRVLAEVLVLDPPALRPGEQVRVSVEDGGMAERPGWREIRAEDSDRGRVVSSNAPRAEPGAGGLRTLRVDRAEFVLRALGDTPGGVTPAPTPAGDERTHHRRLTLTVALALAAALALGALLARITRGLSAVDPRARVLSCVVLAASAATLGAHAGLALALHAAAVLALIVAARPSPRWAISRVALALAWSASLAAVRALSTRGTEIPVALFARTSIALCATLPLAASTGITELADALAGLGLPAALAESTASTARGVVLLRDEALRVARARALRAPDAGLTERVRLYGGWAGTVIARGMERARRAQMAMELRGYDGAARAGTRSRPTVWDFALVLGCVALAAAARWYSR